MSESIAFLYLGLIVLSAKIAGELAHRLKAPSVLGEIIAGIVIGPMLGFVDMSRQGAEFIMYIGNLALLFLLFRIGMETNLRSMISYGRKAFIISSSGVVLSAVLGILWALSHFGLGPGAVKEPIIIGLILLSTSVSIPARILEELDKLELLESTMIIEASVIDDLITLLALSLVLGSLSGGSMDLRAMASTAGRILLFVSIFIVVGRRLLPRIIAVAERMRTPDAQLIVVLSLACFAAVAAEAIGLSYIAGTLLLGIILSDSPEKPEIEERMESICNFIVPVFFVVVGVNMDVGDSRSLLVVGTIITAIAVAGKLVGCGLAARWCGFSPRQSLRVGVAMIPRAEVALVVASVALRQGLIDGSVFGAAVLLTITTAFIGIILVSIAFSGTERVVELMPRVGSARRAPEGVRIRSLAVKTPDDIERFVRASRKSEDVLLVRVAHDHEGALLPHMRRLGDSHDLRKLEPGFYMLSPQWIAATRD